MIQRPSGMGAFQLVTMATLRAKQLKQGCTPRLDGAHKAIVMALSEVIEGKIGQLARVPPAATEIATRAKALVPEVPPVLEPV